jgi:hypothetical protein
MSMVCSIMLCRIRIFHMKAGGGGDLMTELMEQYVADGVSFFDTNYCTYSCVNIKYIFYIQHFYNFTFVDVSAVIACNCEFVYYTTQYSMYVRVHKIKYIRV